MAISRFQTGLTRAAAALMLGAASLGAQAQFTINLNYLAGIPDPVQAAAFTAAKSFWEGVITGYRPGAPLGMTGITLAITLAPIDGPSGTLGFAGPDTVLNGASFKMASTGGMTFDTDDIPALITDGIYGDLIRHEMAHTLGIGTLWTDNGLYVDGTGQYTGAQALAAYRAEYVGQGAATFVPVQLGNIPGTTDGHWAETVNGAGPTGRVDGLGRDMEFELMTGWLNAPTYLSQTTVGSLRDLGYLASLAPIPEPGTWAMLLLGVPLLAGVASRRRRASA